MKTTITGATGLVGSNLAIELLREGHKVRCIRRKSSNVNHLKDYSIEWVDADINDPDSLVRAFHDSDAVFHCAAQVSIKSKPTPALVKANIEGTQCVLDAIRKTGVKRLIHCSSVVATAVSDNGKPVDEECQWNFDKHDLDDGYAITKYESQKLVLKAASSDIDAVIVNPTYMLGPYDPKPSSGKLIIDVVKGRVPGCTDGVNNFVDVRDVCRGMIAAWQKGKRGELYILGNKNLTYQEIMNLIGKVTGVKPPKFLLPKSIAKVAGWFGDLNEMLTGKDALVNSVTVKYGYCKDYLFSSEKAKRELGYNPGPLEKAISDAVEWFRLNGMLN